MSLSDLHIEHLRLHDSGKNEVALKLGLQQALRQVRLQPARLPPSAILVIRHLRSQQPFGLNATDAFRWQKGIQVQIEELARRALRPGKQHIPDNAVSVLFYDEVEALLCFTRDTLARRTAWYWVQLFPEAAYPGRSVGQKLLIGWEAYPQAIPHTVVALKPQEAQHALNSLNLGQLSRLAYLLHETFALPKDVLETAVSDPAPSQNTTQQPSPPWQHNLPRQHFQTLAPQAEYVLGLCHTLVAQPQQARQPNFVQAAQAWLTHAVAHPEAPHTPSEVTKAEALQAPSPPSTKTTEPDQQSNDAPIDHPFADGTATNLGGAVYLLNLLNQLNLPASLPAVAEINPWELLGALTAVLLGDQFKHHQSDPLWNIINELAGLAEKAQWGRAVASADSFHLPPEWLTHFAADTISCRLEKQNGRLRLWLENSDLLLADLPNETSHLPQLIDRYQKEGVSIITKEQSGWTELPNDHNDLLTPNLSWIVCRIRPYLSQYLLELTGETSTTILQQPATLYVSRTHLDLHLSLEQISLPMRQAGLDRTPGWLPDYGYIVTIYFE